MHSYIALMRAVNVGGTGKLPMSVLQAMCRDVGFINAKTYIASGNVVFQSAATAKSVKAELAARLLAYAGKPIGIAVRMASEMAAVIASNPFPKAAPDRTVVIFLDKAPPVDALENAIGVRDEEMRLGLREIYVHYRAGIGISKLRIPAANNGTARNLNTISKLSEMAAQLR
jgi:uncharacterized protein (DUF1697 family)